MIFIYIYIAITFIAWWISARLIAADRTLHTDDYWGTKLPEPRELEAEDFAVAIFQGFFIGVLWPLIALVVVLSYGFKLIFFPDKIDYKAGWKHLRKAFK